MINYDTGILLFKPEAAVIQSYDYKNAEYVIIRQEDGQMESADSIHMEKWVFRVGEKFFISGTCVKEPLIKFSSPGDRFPQVFYILIF